ncbi:hypothetical protein WJX77_002416 [Trebouxia sp. C0004]
MHSSSDSSDSSTRDHCGPAGTRSGLHIEVYRSNSRHSAAHSRRVKLSQETGFVCMCIQEFGFLDPRITKHSSHQKVKASASSQGAHDLMLYVDVGSAFGQDWGLVVLLEQYILTSMGVETLSGSADDHISAECILGLRVAARNIFHCDLSKLRQHLPVQRQHLFTLRDVIKYLASQ